MDDFNYGLIVGWINRKLDYFKVTITEKINLPNTYGNVDSLKTIYGSLRLIADLCSLLNLQNLVNLSNGLCIKIDNYFFHNPLPEAK